ncbi:MAG: hypothetical protein IKI84_09950 [Clostridia bacterium]|nr:hypothetical protein [Clostridia bacterium]
MKKITALILAALMLLSAGFAFADTEPGYYDEDTGRIRMTHQRYIRPAEEDFATVKMHFVDEGFSIFFNGVADSAKDIMLNAILDAMRSGDPTTQIIMPGLILDAEKYTYVKGLEYDSLMCWAATAANMLWQAGYPQNTLSPYTGRPFESVDEVFDYFRHIYTDLDGTPAQGIDALLDGFNPLDGVDGISQLEMKIKALFPFNNVDVDDLVFQAFGKDENGNKLYENIELLQDFNNNTYGITVHWHDPVTGELLNGAHLLTVCGIIVNDEAESLEDRYVGILIADSDNSIVHPDEVPTAPWERPRAAIASNVIDSATLYHLKLVDIPGQGPTWTIVGYNDNITTLDFLWKLPYLQ